MHLVSPEHVDHRDPISPPVRPKRYQHYVEYSTLLYSTILHYSVLCHTILYYTILYYTILSFTILYYTILSFTILYYTILYFTILYYTILYCAILFQPGFGGSTLLEPSHRRPKSPRRGWPGPCASHPRPWPRGPGPLWPSSHS